MTRPVENCPQPDEPMRDRAYTDRQLLELAARAAGLTLDIFVDGKPISREIDEQPVYWNPLADDGDALRLAVKLRINIYNPPTGKTSASVCHGDDGSEICSYFNERSPDPAATRRAIVRAAAAFAYG
jgi:hypothetical protein